MVSTISRAEYNLAKIKALSVKSVFRRHDGANRAQLPPLDAHNCDQSRGLDEEGQIEEPGVYHELSCRAAHFTHEFEAFCNSRVRSVSSLRVAVLSDEPRKLGIGGLSMHKPRQQRRLRTRRQRKPGSIPDSPCCNSTMTAKDSLISLSNIMYDLRHARGMNWCQCI